MQIVNDTERPTKVVGRAGEAPDVVLVATYGWSWAVDALQAIGARVHLAHLLGMNALAYRRVKNDVRDAESWLICCGGPTAEGVDRGFRG